MSMRGHTMEKYDGAKGRFIVKHCTPLETIGYPGIGHLVQLMDRKYENPDAQKRHYLSLIPHKEGTLFDQPPNTMTELPLVHSEDDYRKIRRELLERNSAEKSQRH
jgi:hypothetical protein